MRQCENGKVGIPIADHTTAGELAARYSIVSLNSDVVPGSESITGAIYGGQQQFAALAVSCYPRAWLRFIVPIYGCDSHPIYGREQAESAGTVRASQPFETLAVGAWA
jgi:hypothetical protein